MALKVEGLSVGHQLRGVDFALHEGEVLGVAGLQGHGQRELFMALFGALRSRGQHRGLGQGRSAIRSPRQALSSAVGMALLPEDRRNQGLLLGKSVRENLVLSALSRIVRRGFIDRRAEAAMVKRRDAGNCRSRRIPPEQPVGTLSGGNQQKVVLGKLLATDARILLFYDPTRGVDVGTKAEIFGLMRDLAARGYAILFYSTDLAELANVADRAMVLSYGQVAAILAGARMTEDRILARHACRADRRMSPGGCVPPSAARRLGRAAGDADRACVCLIGALRPGLFTMDQLALKVAAALTLIFVATGETIVVLRGGIDLSVGGILSLATAIAATRGDAGSAGVAVLDGLHPAPRRRHRHAQRGVDLGARLQPFLVTLATWSIVEGVALIVLPSEGGTVPGAWLRAGYAVVLWLPMPVLLLIVLLAWWAWFRRTRLASRIRAAGSNERSAFLNRVSLTGTNVAAYGLSGFFAALAGLFYATQTGAGSPTVGTQYVLPAIAAVVIGGTSLLGGRGGLAGTIVGAFILTLIGDVVFLLSLSSYWQPVVSGLILMLVVVDHLAHRRRLRADRGRAMIGRLVRMLRSPSPILLAYAGALLLFMLVSLYSPGFASPVPCQHAA